MYRYECLIYDYDFDIDDFVESNDKDSLLQTFFDVAPKSKPFLTEENSPQWLTMKETILVFSNLAPNQIIIILEWTEFGSVTNLSMAYNGKHYNHADEIKDAINS